MEAPDQAIYMILYGKMKQFVIWIFGLWLQGWGLFRHSQNHCSIKSLGLPWFRRMLYKTQFYFQDCCRTKINHQQSVRSFIHTYCTFSNWKYSPNRLNSICFPWRCYSEEVLLPKIKKIRTLIARDSIASTLSPLMSLLIAPVTKWENLSLTRKYVVESLYFGQAAFRSQKLTAVFQGKCL